MNSAPDSRDAPIARGSTMFRLLRRTSTLFPYTTLFRSRTKSARSSQRAAAKRPPRVSYGFLFKVFHVCLVVSIVPVVVVTRQIPLPAPWGRLPSPARAGIETNADGEWHRREGEAAMTEP